MPHARSARRRYASRAPSSALLRQKMDRLLANYPRAVIVSGGAKGTDSLAERYAAERGLPCLVFPAEWDKYGKGAGYIRNKCMHEFLARQPLRGCAALWDGKSRGTAHSFGLAMEHGTQLRIIRV